MFAGKSRLKGSGTQQDLGRGQKDEFSESTRGEEIWNNDQADTDKGDT